MLLVLLRVLSLGSCDTYLTERMRLDLRELVLHVVGIHCADLVSSRCTEYFDNLHELVDARFTRE
jgi:hypothetical protein